MKIINIYNIKVNKNFILSNVRDNKVEKAKRYINQYHRIDKPVVLRDGILVDNYTRFIAAYLMEMYDIPYVELNDMSYVIARFDNNNKDYTWKNDKGIDVRVGDKIVVETISNGVKCKKVVSVVNTYQSNDFDAYKKHKSVIGKINK